MNNNIYRQISLIESCIMPASILKNWRRKIQITNWVKCQSIFPSLVSVQVVSAKNLSCLKIKRMNGRWGTSACMFPSCALVPYTWALKKKRPIKLLRTIISSYSASCVWFLRLQFIIFISSKTFIFQKKSLKTPKS